MRHKLRNECLYSASDCGTAYHRGMCKQIHVRAVKHYIWGFAILKTQMVNQMEHEMETWIVYWFARVWASYHFFFKGLLGMCYQQMTAERWSSPWPQMRNFQEHMRWPTSESWRSKQLTGA